MPSILTIARNFPPVGPPGSSIRLVKTIKYLAQEGWSFIVITQDPKKPAVNEKEQSSVLERELPTSIHIKRIPAKFSISDQVDIKSFMRYLAAFDWGIRAIFEGIRQVRKNQIDLLYAGMPNIVNGITTGIVSRMTNTPFVLDIKDDVVGGMFYIKRTGLQKAIEQMLEMFIINSAKYVVFVTQESYELYKKRYPQKSKRFRVIPNGCDLEEFSNQKSIEPVNLPDCFLVLSGASRYRRDYRDAEPFLRSISAFIASNPQVFENVKIVFLGTGLDEYAQLIESLGLSEIVEAYPAVDRNLYRAWLFRADLLFLVQPYNNSTSIAGTLYEYWATGKAPILLFSEEGSSSKLIDQNNIGRRFSYSNIKQAAEYINEVYNRKQAGNPITISTQGIQVFDRRNLTQKMKEVWIDCLTDAN